MVTHPSSAPADFRPRLTYAIVPPGQTVPVERRRALAAAQSAHIASLPIDALLVYDVQDEGSRNGSPRPFPFRPKVDALDYALDELVLGSLPVVVYRAVAQQNEASLCSWLERLEARDARGILVGAPSREAPSSLTLGEAYALCRRHASRVPLGGVVIPERHRGAGTEDARVFAKMREGCGFFVSQTLWSEVGAQRFLRDLRLRAETENRAVPTIIFTLSPCGSAQTLEFLEWLGVDVPASTKRDLLSAKDMFERSIELAIEAFVNVFECAREHGIPVGCNVESVSTRPAEVEASMELLRRVHRLDTWASAGPRVAQRCA